MMQGMTKAITKRAVLLLRPKESFNMEQVPSLSSYPNTPGGGGWRREYLVVDYSIDWQSLLLLTAIEVDIFVDIPSSPCLLTYPKH